MSIRVLVAVVVLLAAMPAALAQPRSFQFDLNNLFYQAYDTSDQPVPFGGLTHSGSVKFSKQGITALDGVLIRTGGPGNPYITQASYSGTLTALSMTILLSNGNVTGGSMLVDINGGPGSGGDRYVAVIDAGGFVDDSVVPVPGSFTIQSLTSHGQYSDANFGGVPIADFFGAQGGNFLTGSFLAFKIQPNAFGKGSCDTDVWVNNIPAPASALLLGAGGLFAARRRR